MHVNATKDDVLHKESVKAKITWVQKPILAT